jgi:hypothetical protein
VLGKVSRVELVIDRFESFLFISDRCTGVSELSKSFLKLQNLESVEKAKSKL